MKLGFVGTGAITEAIIRGALASELSIETIHISPRNAEVAGRLAQCSALVHVGTDNQAVVDAAEIVFLAIRPQIAREVIEALQFRPGQKVVSLIAAVEIDTLHEWIGVPLSITRAIPLPFVADRKGVTAVFPPEKEVAGFFDALGSSVEVASKQEFDLLGAASALMGTYFGILETTARWLEQKGMAYDQAKAYLAPLFVSLSEAASKPGSPTFEQLRLEYSTSGGLNEQVHEDFSRGGSEALTTALNKVLARIEGR
ncbi:NAD(P)-binding domain-containing protein [Rhizobium sp. KVB221]|uniref:NAD(P)-binding domain-containing protein n=1 Tax=Rhizobium setariae TaxID=2801340 RepID=A0A936YN26_9HYPH|nr:pyrroline-5-carboxylate reductase [Rhizobium setariae]MBL0373559.1 NAD(P)-binding domain-containing protein [Rhizobium setariae]